MIINTIILILLCGLIASDFCHRSVYTVNLLAWGAAVIGLSIYRYGWDAALWNMIINGCVLLVISAGVATYIHFKNRRLLSGDKYFGTADVIFVGILTPCMEPTYFIRFLITASVFSLVFWLIVWQGKRSHSIPFVGTAGIVYAVVAILNLCRP